MSQALVGLAGFVLSVFVVGFLPGLLLLIAGRRGKRIDDHPVCRGCGFDLVGTHEPIPDKHPKCPECGTRREPRVGNRQRRGKLALAGVLLMLTSIGVAGVWGYGQFGAAQLAQIKPMWLLRFEARSGTSNTADLALGEMILRFQNGSLTPATAELLMDDAVAHGPAGNPALVNVPLGSKWDTLAAKLMLAGHGTDAERVAVTESWFENRVELRPQVRVGEPVPIRIHTNRLGPPWPRQSFLEIDNGQITIDGKIYSFKVGMGGGGSGSRGSFSSSGSSSFYLESGRGLPRGLGIGTHQLEIVFWMKATGGYRGPQWAQWTEIYVVQFEYVEPDADVIKLIKDAALATAVEQAATVRDGEIFTGPTGRQQSTLDWSSIPANIAYRIFLQRDGRKWELDTFSSPQTSGGHLFGLNYQKIPDELEDGALVDLVFEPDPDVARKTTDLTEILDHTFVIPGIKIVRPVKAVTP